MRAALKQLFRRCRWPLAISLCLCCALSAPAETLFHGLTDRAGKPLDLDAQLGAGRHVVLVFWQSWCASCKAEAPALERASKALVAEAVFVGVVSGEDKNVDERRVDRFIAKTGISYAQVRDRDLALAQRYKVKATPTIVVISPQREIVYQGHHAPGKWSDVLGP